METNLIQLKELFHLEDQDLRSYSPLTLAYIGDGVYELIIRTILVKKGNCPVNRLHKKASSLVKAGAQSAIMEVIEEKLTPEELSVYRRGRNAPSPTMAFPRINAQCLISASLHIIAGPCIYADSNTFAVLCIHTFSPILLYSS